jgi:hypothetical protein
MRNPREMIQLKKNLRVQGRLCGGRTPIELVSRDSSREGGAVDEDPTPTSPGLTMVHRKTRAGKRVSKTERNETSTLLISWTMRMTLIIDSTSQYFYY